MYRGDVGSRASFQVLAQSRLVLGSGLESGLEFQHGSTWFNNVQTSVRKKIAGSDKYSVVRVWKKASSILLGAQDSRLVLP